VRRLEAEARNRLSAQRRPIEQRLRALEEELSQLSADKIQLETLLADPNLYAQSNREKLKSSLLQRTRTNARLELLEEEWLLLHERLEALEAER